MDGLYSNKIPDPFDRDDISDYEDMITRKHMRMYSPNARIPLLIKKSVNTFEDSKKREYVKNRFGYAIPRKTF